MAGVVAEFQEGHERTRKRYARVEEDSLAIASHAAPGLSKSTTR